LQRRCFQKWHVDGCESFAEVRERMRKALTEIAEAHRKRRDHRAETVA